MLVTTFTERANEFCILKGYAPKTLAQAVGVTHATLLNALSGRHAPSTRLFFGLLQAFDCSADYLLGLTNDSPENAVYRAPMQSFGKRFARLLQESGVSQYALTRAHGISGNLIYRWLRDLTYPSPETMAKLATALHCSVDYLLGRTDF